MNEPAVLRQLFASDLQVRVIVLPGDQDTLLTDHNAWSVINWALVHGFQRASSLERGAQMVPRVMALLAVLAPFGGHAFKGILNLGLINGLTTSQNKLAQTHPRFPIGGQVICQLCE